MLRSSIVCYALLATHSVGFFGQLPKPKPLSGHNLVYSSSCKAVVLVGGDQTGKTPLMKWTGKSWEAIPNSESVSRSLAAVATEPSGNILVFGGAIGQPKDGNNVDWKVQGDLVRWDGKAWTPLSASGPTARDHCSMVYDPERKVMVLFGGSDADPSGRTKLFGDTWEWDGREWSKKSEGGPTARAHHAMVYDPLRKVTLMVGGEGATGPDGKTWAWDGKNWHVVAQGMPGYLGSPRMAFFKKIGKVVLFGGSIRMDNQFDTWLWDGKAWEKLKVSGPAARTVHGLAYDEVREVVVMFGGYGSNSLDDTWEFDGKAWEKR